MDRPAPSPLAPGSGTRRRGPDAGGGERLARAGRADTLATMSDQITPSALETPARSRRPQAERSADTQNRLIDAAISCLHRLGYGATTVTLVAQEAGVSRGAMTHQYPAKTDLMLAVVQAVFEADSRHYEQTVAAMPPLEWMHRLPAIMWDVLSRPSAIAVTEIMLAARSDAELAQQLRTMQADIDVRSHAWIVERLAVANLQDRPDGNAVHRLFVAAVRGLALEALFRRDQASVEEPIQVLTEVLHLLYPALDAKP